MATGCARWSGRRSCRTRCARERTRWCSSWWERSRGGSWRAWRRRAWPRRCYMLLALDTSTALASVALYDGTLRAEATWPSGRTHSQQVLPMAVRLLEEQGLGPDDLTAVAVAIGPGSYTGVRVGV